MIEKWFSTIELPLTFQQFEQLPQNPAYKYEYFQGQAWLTPRPKHYHALLDLRTFLRPLPSPATRGEILIRPLTETDWERFPPLFAAAFHRMEPFCGLADPVRVEAAEECLRRTRDGADGPLIPEASFVAANASEETPLGALLTTLAPGGDPAEWDSWRWTSPPPLDALARRMGRPHLTWVFVGPWYARLGVGTALLDAAVAALTRLGYMELASTFLLGNESSTLWHWRMGFRVQPYPGSLRKVWQEGPDQGQ